ncbi:MAG: hypothetical protein KGZ39_04205 [Simkania sp.]|nr:hypothetical protein [Simkania sp.]
MSSDTKSLSAYYSHLPLPNYANINALPKAPTQGAAVFDHLTALVDSFANTLDYNGLGLVCQYTQFYQERKFTAQGISEAQAFKEFQPNPVQEIDATNGATCIGQSQRLVQLIKEKLQLQAYIAPAQKSPSTPPHHASIVVPCEDSIVLINPTDPPRMLLINYDTPKTVKIKGEDYVFFIPNGGVSISKTEVSSGTLVSTYLVANLTNSAEAVAKWSVLQRRQYPVVSYDAEGKVLHVIKIDVDHETIILQKGDGKSAIRLERPFSSFNLQSNTFSKEGVLEAEKMALLSEDFFSSFKTPQGILKLQIRTIIDNTRVIQNLYDQTETPRFRKPATPPLPASTSSNLQDHILREFTTIYPQTNPPQDLPNTSMLELETALQKAAPLDSQTPLNNLLKELSASPDFPIYKQAITQALRNTLQIREGHFGDVRDEVLKEFNALSRQIGPLQPVYEFQLGRLEAALQKAPLNSQATLDALLGTLNPSSTFPIYKQAITQALGNTLQIREGHFGDFRDKVLKEFNALSRQTGLLQPVYDYQWNKLSAALATEKLSSETTIDALFERLKGSSTLPTYKQAVMNALIKRGIESLSYETRSANSPIEIPQNF